MTPESPDDATPLRELYWRLQAEHRALKSAAVPDMPAIDAVLRRLDEVQAELKATGAFHTNDHQRY